MEKRKTSPYVYRKGNDVYVVVGNWHRRLQPRHTDVKAKLADMDPAGISVTALSINDPRPELFGKDGPAIARLLNDFIAEVSKNPPSRFTGLAVLPLQNMNAASELERCVNKLGKKGFCSIRTWTEDFRMSPSSALCSKPLKSSTYPSCCILPVPPSTKGRSHTK
jgi:aminocarboxymuconate-semialdehyde decarboxylase